MEDDSDATPAADAASLQRTRDEDGPRPRVGIGDVGLRPFERFRFRRGVSLTTHEVRNSQSWDGLGLAAQHARLETSSDRTRQWLLRVTARTDKHPSHEVEKLA